MASDAELTPRLQQLYDVFPRLDHDVSVITIYERFTGGPMTCDQRYAQQWLGSYFTKLNRRLRKRQLAVRPGRLKHAYRLVSTK